MALAVVSVTHTTFLTDATAHLVTMPTTVVAGELLVCFFASDGSATVTTPSGWTLLYSTPQSTTARGSAYTKIALGTEGGTTVDFVTSAVEQAAAQVYRLTGAMDALTHTVGTAVVGVAAGTTVDPPVVTASWGALADNLFITCVANSGSQTLSSGPSGWGTPVTTNDGGGGQAAASASCYTSILLSSNASENPPVFTFSATGAVSVANTIVIRSKIGTVGTPVNTLAGAVSAGTTTHVLSIPATTAGVVLLINSHARRASTTLAPDDGTLADSSAAPLTWTPVFTTQPSQVGLNPGTKAQWWWAISDGAAKTVTLTWGNAGPIGSGVFSSVASFTVGAGLLPDFYNLASAGSTGTPSNPVTATLPIPPTTGISYLSFYGAGGGSSTIATGYTSLTSVASSPYRTGYDVTPQGNNNAVMGSNFPDQLLLLANITERAAGAVNSIGYGQSVTASAGTASAIFNPSIRLLTSYTPGTDRNDFTGEVGVRLGIGTLDINIDWIGARRHHATQTGTHTVYLYEWFSGVAQRTVVIDYTGIAVGDYAWTAISPFTLAANGYYAILMETTASDGQIWCNPGATTFASSILNVYDSYRSGGALFAGSPNAQFIGFDLGVAAAGAGTSVDAATNLITASVGTVSVTTTIGVSTNLTGNQVTTDVGTVSITATTGGGWSPNIITGLAHWLDASTLGLADGAAITTWPNPGSGPDPTFDGSPSPVCKLSILAGKSVVRISSGQGRVRGVWATAVHDYDLVYVCRRWGTGVGRAFSVMYPPSNLLVGMHASGTDLAYDNGNFIYSPGGTAWPSTPPDPWKIYGGNSATGSGFRFYINGTYIGYQLGVGGLTGGWGLSGFETPGGGETMDLDVAEMVLYDHQLADADRQAVEGYLAWKWGLEANLPVGHLYKSAPPVGPTLVNGFDVTPGLLLPIVFAADSNTSIGTINTTGPFANAAPAGYDDWYGAPDVTVNLVGSSATVSVGTVTASASLSFVANGQQLATTVGTVSFKLGVSISVTSTGLTASLSGVDVTAGGSISISASSPQLTASVGNESVPHNATFVTTNFVTASMGDETIRLGTSTTAATNLLTVGLGNESVIQGLGVSTTAATNLITVGLGNESVNVVQNMTINIVMPLFMTASTNPVTVLEGFRVLVNVIGPPVTASVGNETVAMGQTIFVTGNQVTASINSVAVIQPITLYVEGQEVAATTGGAYAYTVTNVSLTGQQMVVGLGNETVSLPREVEVAGSELTAYAGSITSFILNHNIAVVGYQLTASVGLAYSPNWGTTPDDAIKEGWTEPAAGPGEGWTPLPKRQNAWTNTPDVPDEIWNRQTHPPNDWTH